MKGRGGNYFEKSPKKTTILDDYKKRIEKCLKRAKTILYSLL